MTYPPQPPGPPQGPYGPPPPGQYNQGPNPYQPPPWAGGPPGYPMGPPPERPRKGLIATLIIVAILVVGAGGVATYLLINKDDPGAGSGQGGGEGSGARAAAQTYVRELENALNTPVQDVDLGKLEPIACTEDFAKMADDLDAAKDVGQSDSAAPGDDGKTRIRLKDFERTSDGGKFTLTRRVAGSGGDADTRNMTVTRKTVAKQDAGWVICGLYDEAGDDQSGDPSGEDSSGPSPSRELPPNPIPTT